MKGPTISWFISDCLAGCSQLSFPLYCLLQPHCNAESVSHLGAPSKSPDISNDTRLCPSYSAVLVIYSKRVS